MSGDIDLAAIVAEDAKTSGAVPQEAPAPVDETAEATTAPGDEPAEEQPTEAGSEEAPQPRKPGGGFQKRISELTREKHEAKREAEQLREMLSKALGQTQQPAPAAEQSDEPRPEQYARYEDYVRAVARYDAARETKAFLSSVRKQASVEDQEKARIEAVKAFEVEAKAQGKAIQGFDDALDMVRSDDFPMTPAVATYLLKATQKAALVKYLADNPDAAYEYARMTDVEVGRELAKVEMRFASKPRPKTSSAPPPPATVSGGAAAPQSIERMGHNDVLKWVRELDQRR